MAWRKIVGEKPKGKENRWGRGVGEERVAVKITAELERGGWEGEGKEKTGP